MEALTTLHHRHQPLCSSLHPSSLTSTTVSSLFLSNPSPSPSPSSSIRAISSPSPPSSESLQNLQYPELKTPHFFNPLVKVPNFDPPLQDPEPKSPQFLNPNRKFPSFITATVAASASAFLFLGCCQNGFNKPVMSLSSVVSIEEKLDDDDKSDFVVEEFLGSKPDNVESVLHLKMKEKVHIVHSFNKIKTNDDEAWLVLRAEVFSCSKNLELIKVGFETILEKDMDCNDQDRVLEYLEKIDDCNSCLKGIKVAMDRCEKSWREEADIRFFCKVVDHIKVLEGDMVGALKYFKQNKSE